MSKLLINESPMMFQQTLATKIGLNEAIILQQTHYLLNPKFNKNIKDGRNWVYNSYAEWKEKEFPFFSEDTIKRGFLSLERQGLVDSKRLSKNSRDRTKWYSINYDNVSKLELLIGTSVQNAPMECHEGKILRCIGAKSSVASVQNAPMSKVQENIQEITQENNTVEFASDSTPASDNPSVILEAEPMKPNPEPEPEDHPEPLATVASPSQPKQPNVNSWAPVIASIFAYWQAVLNHPRAKLDANRRRCIVNALKLGFSEEELKKAIDGISKTPHNMGINDRGEVYDGLHIVFRNSEQIERFIRNFDTPPTTRTKNVFAGEKKPHFMDVHRENMKAAEKLTDKYFPKLSKYFGSKNPVGQTAPVYPQLRQEIVVNAI